MTQTLHPFQAEAIKQVRADFRQHQNIVLVLPTGAGKTVVAGHITTELMRQFGGEGVVALFLVHKHELVWQAVRTLEQFGLGENVGVIMAGQPAVPWKPLQVAMLPTLVRRLETYPWLQPKMLFVDEAHHARANTWDKVLSHWGRSYRLGLTATPERLDGKGLHKFFQHMIQGPQISQLQPEYLAPIIVAQPPSAIEMARKKRKDGDGPTIADRMSNFELFCADRRTIIFESSIASSQDMAHKLRAAGHAAEHVDGKMPTDERRRIIERFDSGQTTCLTNVDIVSEGFDCPACEAVIHACYTKSMTRYRQRNGRAMRVKPDGGHGIIVDLAGMVWQHGHPDADMSWSLQDGHLAEAGEAAPYQKWQVCSHCRMTYPRSATICPQCGSARPVKLPNEIDLDLLVTAGGKTKPRLSRQEIGRMVRATHGNMDQLRQIAREYGYSPRWPAVQLAVYFPHLITGTERNGPST